MSDETAPGGLATIHRDAYVVEGHRDCYEQIHWQNMGEENPVRDRLLPRLDAGGVDLVVYSVGGDSIAHSNGRDKKLLATIENLENLRRSREAMTPPSPVVLCGADIPDSPDGRVRFLLHLEGGSPLEGSMMALEALFELGVRSMQPTWNLRNELGDGVRERHTSGGLTAFGVAVVTRMEQLGMVIDLAHMSEPGFWHALEVTNGPVIVSHANSRAVYDHPRNLGDDQVRAIAERGGVVGIHTLPTFTGAGEPTIEDLVRHVEHFVEVAGIEHVAFGGDFVACDGPRPSREALFHDPRHAPPTLEGLQEAHDLPNFTRALLERGFADKEVRAILGANYQRVLREVLPAGTSGSQP
ncbi:MAG: membrane dipeptidase [Acidimicrobiaceae bacterium]|nr:membrane dipeptidase [Acidimicrobiaceae bacterium]